MALELFQNIWGEVYLKLRHGYIIKCVVCISILTPPIVVSVSISNQIMLFKGM